GDEVDAGRPVPRQADDQETDGDAAEPQLTPEVGPRAAHVANGNPRRDAQQSRTTESGEACDDDANGPCRLPRSVPNTVSDVSQNLTRVPAGSGIPLVGQCARPLGQSVRCPRSPQSDHGART